MRRDGVHVFLVVLGAIVPYHELRAKGAHLSSLQPVDSNRITKG